MTSDPVRRARFEAVAGEVYEPLQRYLRRRATAADAADVLGDTMLVVWRRLDEVPAEALPWCYGVARRSLANQRRGGRRRAELIARVATHQVEAHVDDPQSTIESGDPELVAAIGALTDSEAEIVRLWAWEQLEPREIALVLDLTPNAVSVALSRSKRKLAEQLDRTGRQDRGAAGHVSGDGAAEQEGHGR